MITDYLIERGWTVGYEKILVDLGITVDHIGLGMLAILAVLFVIIVTIGNDQRYRR